MLSARGSQIYELVKVFETPPRKRQRKLYGVDVLFGSLFSGVHVGVLHIWGINNGPWIQGLHACFFIGCTLAPVLVKPFLSVEHASDGRGECSSGSSRNESAHSNGLHESVSTNLSLSSGMMHADEDVAIEIWKPYLIAGVILFVPSIVYILTSCVCPESIGVSRQKQTAYLYDKSRDDAKTRAGRLILIGLMTIFFFVVNSMERGVSNYLLAYVAHCLGWYKGDGALLKTAYQASSFTGRFLCILLVRFVPIYILLIVICFLCQISITVMVIWGHHVTVMWLSVVLMGLSGAPMYGLCLSWCSQYIFVTGKIGAIFTTTGPFSDIIASLIINLLYDKFGLATFRYYCLVMSVSMILCYFSIAFNLKFILRVDKPSLTCETEIPLEANSRKDHIEKNHCSQN